MTADNQSVLHLVNPIAGLGDLRIVRHQEQRFSFFLDDALEQLEGAPGILAVEISRGFIGEDHARIISERARDRHALLLATGEMAAWTFSCAVKSSRRKWNWKMNPRS